MKKMSKYVTTGLLGMTLLGSLAGCGGAAESDTDAASSESGYDETITIDVYNGLANYMGMQEGWFAKTETLFIKRGRQQVIWAI
jgi:multiple sugar transport system substrate-binding protein/putative aldouronate transport system substrate-binding protein